MASRSSWYAWRVNTAVTTTAGAARSPRRRDREGRALERLREHHREIVCRHAHHLLALQAMQRCRARDLLELAQAPLLVAPLERGVEIQVRLDGPAVFQVGAVQDEFAPGRQVAGRA